MLVATFQIQADPPTLPAGQTRQLAEGVYYVPDLGTALVPNVGIVVGQDSVLVVDTGMGPENARVVLDEVRRVSDLPIKYLVTTHFHPEHNFGAQAFPEETILLYSEAQRLDVVNKGEHYKTWFVEMFGADVEALLEPVVLVSPDVTFEERAYFDLGSLPVQVLYFGRSAHTGGDTVVFLPEQRIAFVGDLVPNGSFPIFPDEDSSVDGWLATLEDIRMLDIETIVPSHGGVGTTALIDPIEAYLSALRQEARDLRARGVTLESAQEQLTETFTARYPDWDEPHWIANAVGLAYAESQSSD